MATARSPLPPAPDEAHWFRRPAHPAAARVWRESVTARDGSFQARLRLCEDGGCVVTFPALPQLRVRGATCQHARVKALALLERYLRTLHAERLPAAPKSADDWQFALRLAA